MLPAPKLPQQTVGPSHGGASAKEELQAAVTRINHTYHKGRQVLEIKRGSDIRCSVCDRRFIRVPDAASHCTQRSHHSLLAESLEEEARDLRRKAKQLKHSEKTHATKRVNVGLPPSELTLSEEAYTLHILTTLTPANVSHRKGVDAPEPLQLLWAPEVLQPKSNVHYVHARANNNALRNQMELERDAMKGEGRRTLELPAVSAFRLIPVQFTGSLKSSQPQPTASSSPVESPSSSPALQPPPSHQWCMMQHASSGLFVSASLAPRGLLWLHEKMDEAVLVRFIPGTSHHASKRNTQRFHLVLRAQPKRSATRGAPLPSPVVEWIASVYAPEKPQVSHDLGTFTEERRSLVLTEYNYGSVKGPMALFHFEVHVTSVPTQLPPPPPSVPKVRKPVVRSAPAASSMRRRNNNSDGDDASTSSEEASEADDDDDDDAADTEATFLSTSSCALPAEYDDDASSGDEEFLALAHAHRDAFSLFTRRQQVGTFFQDRCVCKRRTGSVMYYCSPLGAEKFTVIGFGERDVLVRYYRAVSVTQQSARARWTDDPEKANCMLCTLTAGIPGKVSSCRIPVLVTTRTVKAGESFLCLSSSLTKFPSNIAPSPMTPSMATQHNAAAQTNKFLLQHHPPAPLHPAPLFCDTEWYVETYRPDPAPEAAVPLASVLPRTMDNGVPLVESQQPLYYYGNHASLALPHRDAVLQFPFNLIQVRPCMRLRGELEVVAKHFVPMGTCFLYCGPKIRRKDESDKGAISTAMSIDRMGRRIKGGNIMKFVNHRFGFAEEGNVAFRRGAIMYRRRHFPERGPVETHINFFIATKDIPAGELLLAEGYGPEYDSFIERIAYCGGRYLSAEERLWLTEQGAAQASSLSTGTSPTTKAPEPSSTPGSYAGCYVTDIHVGSIVGRRCPLPDDDSKRVSSTSSMIPSRIRRRLDGTSSLYADEAAEDGRELGASRVVFYRVTAITDDNVLLGEELEHEFPYLFDRYPDGTGATVQGVAVLRKTEAILFIPGWDYEDATLPKEVLVASRSADAGARRNDDPAKREALTEDNIGWCARLKMPKDALGRATYADLVQGAAVHDKQ